jgi:hypothetical protein
MKPKTKAFLILVSFTLSVLLPPQLYALSFTIDGNGSGSENEVSTSLNQTVVVEQTNDTSVDNQINVSSDTGNNQLEANTGGDASITTGDSAESVLVTNQLNSNETAVSCCLVGPVTASITQNGAESENKLEIEISRNINITSEQQAKVANTVESHQNTGDIHQSIAVTNHLNLSLAKVACCDQGVVAFIGHNGSATKNHLKYKHDGSIVITSFENAWVDNQVKSHLNTGGNKIWGALNALISTGKIHSLILLNTVANLNQAEVICDCPEKNGEEKPPEEEKPPAKISPTPIPTPTAPVVPPAENGEPPLGAVGGVTLAAAQEPRGDVLGAMDLLPITGSNLLLLLLANLFIFLMGSLLRRYSKPSIALNKHR